MSLEKCEKCGSFYWDWEVPHECPPIYLVVCEEVDPDEVREIYAADEEVAVELWAEEWDSEDLPDIANGMGDVDYRLRVMEKGGLIWQWYTVTGEWQAKYSARKVGE